MKWFTHKAVAVAGALAAGSPLVGLVAVLCGSVVPDAIDTALTRGDKRRWWKFHRQSSHWFGWYFLIMGIGIVLASYAFQGSGDPIHAALRQFSGNWNLSEWKESGLRLLGDLCFWFGFGGLCHVLLDGLTPMGVPMFPAARKPRFGIKLVKTGGWGESVFLVVALILIALQFDKVRSFVKLAIQHFS